MFRLLVAAAAGACVFASAATAAAPQLKYPHHVGFGSAVVGSVGGQTVTLTNRGTTPLTVFSIGVSSDTGSFILDFPNDHCVGTTLAPGESCTYAIKYTPVIPGRQVGTSDVEFGTAGLVFIKLSGHAS
jgi:trimeric autotransporter adhesin